MYVKCFLLILPLLCDIHSNLQAQACVEIERILVAACTPSPNPPEEGYNEMIYVRTGNTPVNAGMLSVTWPSSNQVNFYSWLGRVQNLNTANKVKQINATIKACGFLKEPPANGIIPPNSKVIIFTSNMINPSYNSFADLSDTVYVIFQNNFSQTAGHFLNYSTLFGGIYGSDNQTTIVDFGPNCRDQVTYFRSKLTTTLGSVGNEKGASVLFTNAGAASYYNRGCTASFPPFSADWKNPGTICSSDPPINLDSYITGNKGGTFSGPGVNGNTFNPSGLSGQVTITYSVKSGNCTKTQQNTLTINGGTAADWTPPGPICAGTSIQLSTLVSGGLTGGTWTGTGVSNGVFNSAGLSGDIPVTYTLGSGNCKSVITKNIQVLSKANAAWGPLPPSICESDPAINLTNLITGTKGGDFSGQGVSNNLFSPAGLNGSVSIKYLVGGQGCKDSSIKSITINPAPKGDWTSPGAICPGTIVQLSGLLSPGTITGGVWSGTGVTNGSFNSSGLSGSFPITYTAGSGNCKLVVTKDIIVTAKASASWGPLPKTICQTDPPINLNALITGTTGGIFSGQGVSGNTFSPLGLNGAISIIYKVGASGCSDSLENSISITTGIDAKIIQNGDLVICGNEKVNLRTAAAPGNFVWSTGETSQSINVSVPGLVKLIVTGPCNKSTDSVLIKKEEVSALFQVSSKTGIAPLLINVSPNINTDPAVCEWFLDGKRSDSLENGPLNFDVPGKYAIKRICMNAEGCKDEFTQIIEVFGLVEVFIPNSFSPDGNEINAIFKAEGIGIKTFRGEIFNRWGESLFLWEDFNNGWDGTYKGLAVPEGVYVYRMEFVDGNDKKFEKIGRVTLIN